MNAERNFWTTVAWEETDVPAWGPIIYRQLLEDAERFVTDWALPEVYADGTEAA